MDGEWETAQLTPLLEPPSTARCLAVLKRVPLLADRWSVCATGRGVTRAQARENIAAHYDLGNTFYAHFLDRTALFQRALPQTSRISRRLSRPKWRACDQLALSEADHLLEIGTGWGAMAEYAARHYGCRVTTTTLSQEQYVWATERIARAGLQDRVEVLLCDYRDLTGQYDKLVSIEMIEAVGQRYLPTFFRTCQARLRPGTNGDSGHHHSGPALSRLQQKRRFYPALHFPGGFLPSITAMNELMTRHTDFVVRNLFDMGPDYARTLAHWRQRAFHAWQEIEKLGFDERFRRMWLITLATVKPGLTPAPSAWCS
jgi:cyclopropane-fatty-acyl-phospholipid synthase